MGENMKKIESMNEIIGFNSSFKSSVNLYLSLNKREKILSYIPTKSSNSILSDYINSVINQKEQATLLIGPYGKGKSHLLLVLLSVLSMERNENNEQIIDSLVNTISSVDEAGAELAECITTAWKRKRFLPVLISNTTSDLSQAFIYALNDALKKAGLSNITPDTYYSIAVDKISDWKNNYNDTYTRFKNLLAERNDDVKNLISELKLCNKKALSVFSEIYPLVTSGSEFSPMVVSNVLELYKDISERLIEEYDYSGIYIVFDEFSKFIEGQSNTLVGGNMRLLQDICELANDSKNPQIHITLVAHKSIKEYGKFLSPDIINSFTGIEGRLIEKYFITSSKNNYELVKNAIVKDDKLLNRLPNYEMLLGESALKRYYYLPVFRSAFSQSDFESVLLRGCYPLNPIATYVLLNISEKVAQNERTLFTFISNDEPNSMARYVNNHTFDQEWSIGVDTIYDYFSTLFRKEVVNELIHNIWLSAEYALEKCNSLDEKRFVKALAIILIVNKPDEIPSDEKYISLSLGGVDITKAVSELSQKQLVYKKNSTGTFAFKTRAGVELKQEIKKQRELKGDNVNYAKALSDITGKYYVVPRKYNTIFEMTRYFNNQFMLVEDFLSINSSEVLLSDCTGDGKVITLFSLSPIKIDAVKKHVEILADSRIVVLCPKKPLKVQRQLRDYEIIQSLATSATFTNDNEILKKELPLLSEDLTMEIEDALASTYVDDDECKVIYYDGNLIVLSANSEEEAVNICCEKTYTKTVRVNNELVNRKYISTAQSRKTRSNIIAAILEHTITEDYYRGSNQEATVYRSLFCRTGVEDDAVNSDLALVFKEINNYIDSCCDQKKTVKTLIDTLVSPPFGFRAGLIPFYFAYVVSRRHEDIIVYFSDKEVQLNADIIVNLCENPNDYAMFVSKEDLQKEKYINELNILFNVAESRNLSTNRIKNIIICMQRWFRSLPQAVRNGVSIDQYVDEAIANNMIAVKKALQKVEFNPFEILFVDFPEQFNSSSIEETYEVIDNCKLLYDDYFDWLHNKAVEIIYSCWGNKRKKDLHNVLVEWYEKQSVLSKQGLHDGRITNFMSCLSGLDVYGDFEIAERIVKAVMDVYIENWNIGSVEEFKTALTEIKDLVEGISDNSSAGEMKLSFVGQNGDTIEKMYSHSREGSGAILKNIIEDALDDFDDLSVNDRVSILLEMIERIIK